MANNILSSQQSILAGLNSQPLAVLPKDNGLPVYPTQKSSTSPSTKPDIKPATHLPEGADLKVKCPGAQFKPRSITLEGGVVTTKGNTITYHRTVFGNDINLFDYKNTVARDTRWIAGLLHRAGVERSIVTSGRVGANIIQAQFERQLQTLGINTLAVAKLTSSNNGSLWQKQPTADKWLKHAEPSQDLPLPQSLVSMTA